MSVIKPYPLLNYPLLNKKSQEGIGLVEVIIALGMAIVIVTAMVSLGIYTLRATTQNEMLVQGTRLSNQQMERVRAYRDQRVYEAGWDAFIQDLASADCTAKDCINGNVCYVNENFTFPSTPSPIDDITTCFYPVFDPSNDDIVDIVTVSTWTIGGERKFARNYSRLSNWVY